MLRERGIRFCIILIAGEIVLYFLQPPGLNPAATRLLFSGWLPVAAWLSELMPLGITALLFPVLGTTLGIVPARAAFSPFAHPLIFLFIGSFLAARAIEKYGCADWITHRVLNNAWMQQSLYRYTLGIGALVFTMSMWLSNTATVAALLPLVPALAESMEENARRSFKKMVLLLIAYTSSVGGIGTPVGTPPNLVALGLMDKMAPGRPVPSFVGWMAQALPLGIVLFFCLHFYLYRRYGRWLPWSVRRLHIPTRPLQTEDRRTLGLFFLLVLLWFLPGIVKISWPHSPFSSWLHGHWPEVIPAVLVGCLYFIVQDGQGRPLLVQSDLARIDWGTILLFGGGLSFGTMAHTTGLINALVEYWTGRSFIGSWLPFVVMTAIAIIATELFSNTAMSNILVPVAIVFAQEHHLPLWPMVLGTTLGCSMAFMLPVATPPNAIVFGTQNLTLRDMMKAGWFANTISLIGISLLIFVLIRFGL